MNLNEISSDVRECTKCRLHHTRTLAVPGVGEGVSGIMFVGEAPGRSEDLRGRPFVGQAGRILNQALEEAGIARESVYITNVVKCRPPGNRVPKEDERQACRDHLEREIQAINPHIICIMGNTAYGSMLGGSDITHNRGRLIKKDGRLYYTTIHPAAAIYNRELGGVLGRDIRRLLGLVRDIQAGREPEYESHP